MESYDWSSNRFVIGEYRSWDTTREFRFREQDTKTGVAIGQWDWEARFILKAKEQSI
jgi:hypothetical protein